MMTMQSETTTYFCEKHQRNHKKGSKVYDDCFSEHVGKATDTEFNKAVKAAQDANVDIIHIVGSGKAGVVAKKWNELSDKEPPKKIVVFDEMADMEKWDDAAVAGNWSAGENIMVEVGKASDKASEYGKDFQIPVKMTKETYDRLMHEKITFSSECVNEKVANYRAERWEFFKAPLDRRPRELTGNFAYFSPAEMLQFAKRIAIAQGKKWHWWNEKKRMKECKKAGIHPENVEG